MVDVEGDTVNPKMLIIPKYTTTERDLLGPEIGTIIYDTTQNELCFNTSTALAATDWNVITSSAQG